MINFYEVAETNQMIEQENLDVRTITLGISLLDCIDSDLEKLNEKIYNKIVTIAKDLVETGNKIEKEFGIPIVNKRISITPIALVGGSACKTPEDYVTIARTLDEAAKTVGVNFIGGYSALVSKGMTKSDENLIRSIPMALASTERVCSSVNVGSLCLEKLEAMTCVCSVGLDMIAIPGKTSSATISGIIADEMAIGMVNQKTTAVRLIPVIGKDVGDVAEFGGLLGYAPIMPVNEFDCSAFINRQGRIPAPIHSFKN